MKCHYCSLDQQLVLQDRLSLDTHIQLHADLLTLNGLLLDGRTEETVWVDLENRFMQVTKPVQLLEQLEQD